ncbi:SusC/RagA family TonB-linked outer membrane protein [Flavobacterium sp.]|jgi:TonB-linked SusC/RagA family outer membrane protein|uniref:SusC/RagA family TonB-linked outer membrane protein n=1 Tax=Flavobacterium sp. TaxID=239 RepID=UPI0037C01F36
MKTISKKLLFLLLLLPLSVLAQSTVSGVVSDKSSGQPLPGVNVIIKGTSKGTTTDFDGKYVLSNVTSGEVIEFSYVGFTTQDVPYASQKTINVSLEEETAKLDEVVLVGYGAVKKKDATGSVTQVTTKDFNKGANVTAESLLNGRVAGVTINQSGAPGSGSEIRIRGGSSLLASNDPLIVIDGLPVSNSTGEGATSILSSINPNDIESFTVLKDASATAIYGSRASNGVIIITTKRAGKNLQVDYNFQYGSGKKFNQVDVYNADQFRTVINTEFEGNAAVIGKLGSANTDWQDEIYRRTDFVDNNLSIKGNLFKTIPVRLSVGNTYQEGLRLTNKFNRNSVSLNLSPEFFENHLKFRIAANFTNQKNRFAAGVEGAAIRFDPTQPVYDAESPYDGFFEYRNGQPGTANFLAPATRNPVAQLLQTYDTGVNNRFFGNFEIDYKLHFLPQLRAVVNMGYDQQKGNRNIQVSRNALTGFINGTTLFGNDSYSESTVTNKLLDSYLVYNSEVGNLVYEVTGGYSYQIFENEGSFTRNRNNPQDVPGSYVNDDIVLIGFFGRANLNFSNKYLLTLNYRRDGTSRFGEENRWGNFPSVAFAWKLKEDFFAESTKLSDLKLRLGWGITGQQDIAAGTFYLPKYNIGDPFSQYIIGGAIYPVGSPESYGPVKWEETYSYNVGLDFGFMGNRLTGALDLFYKQSYDLFQTAPFPDGGNFSNQGPQNIGDMSTKGIEFSIAYDVIKKEDITWNVSFNATKYERRIDELALGQPLFTGFTGAGTGGTSQILQEGFTPNSFFVYKQLYDVSGSPIEGAFADLDGNGIINGEDRYIYKNPDPDFLLGFATNLNYKNFDLGFNLRASVGNRILNTTKSTRSYSSTLQEGQALENISTFYEFTGFQQQNGENVLSDLFVENGSFLRMDYATLGYTFPKWLEGKASVRLFASVQNPFIITEYDGLDPEITGGIDATIYPRQRQFLFGVNVKF